MGEFYSTDQRKDDIKRLNITKQDFLSQFHNPMDNSVPSITKKKICMDWCIYQQWRDNWIDKWFMVFEKSPNNNMEVPLYFPKKLWVEFMLGLHVNYFDIGEFQGLALGSAQDREHARCYVAL